MAAAETAVVVLPELVLRELRPNYDQPAGGDLLEPLRQGCAAALLMGPPQLQVTGPQLDALQQFAKHAAAEADPVDLPGWHRFYRRLIDARAALTGDIAWHVEHRYHHPVSVRSSWQATPTGARRRIFGTRVDMGRHNAGFACWVQAGNGRLLGVVADTQQPYSVQALAIAPDRLEDVCEPILRDCEAGTDRRHEWPFGDIVDVVVLSRLILLSEPSQFAYGTPDSWFR